MSAIKKSNTHPSGCSPHHHYKDTGILMRKLAYCRKSHNIVTWQKVATEHNWHEIRKDSESLLKLIILYVCHHPLGHIVIVPILELNVLNFEDIERISQSNPVPHPTVIELLIAKLYEIATCYPALWVNVETVVNNFSVVRTSIDQEDEDA
jgi:hypothetical protein